jgi:hypothetical protein
LSLALAVRGEQVWAAAADASRGTLGLAAAPAEIMSDAVASAVFGPEDLRRLRPLGGDWLVRAWCARRAAAAAFGREAEPDDLRGFVIDDLDPVTGTLRMKTTGDWISAMGAAQAIDAATLRRDDRILALCRFADGAIRA